ncbi:hypothetical protein TNCT_611321 [Trichonephila clavata]|uniref:Uncharacterized protein n=1 Tax=Trichonephila clavata TaxID=2740835 RepID=A0A8X6K8P0_TRICU|nr:hypothetical protein TNCT_611321 [Trichonephila clavata]
MHVRKASTLSLEKTELLDKLLKLEESDLEKADKLARIEEKSSSIAEVLYKQALETRVLDSNRPFNETSPYTSNP